jgi:hypothetical protein
MQLFVSRAKVWVSLGGGVRDAMRLDRTGGQSDFGAAEMAPDLLRGV